MDNQVQQNQPKKRKWLWWVVGIIGLFIIVGIFFDGNNNTSSPASNGNESTEKAVEQKSGEVFTKVTNFTGNKSGKSEEFSITSKEIKFVYRCDDGPHVCVGWLTKVGGTKQELFRSSGSTGTLSEQKTLSIGPGTFYIETDTDRTYTIDVFQGATLASAEETTNTQTKVDESKKYRIVNGFKLTYENTILGVLVYHYKTNDGVYSVELQIEPKATDFEFDSGYTLAEGGLEISGIDIRYAFNEVTKINDIEIDKSYESAEFVFIKGDKTYTGFVTKNKEVDQAGIESTLKLFVNALVSNILNNK